jgi:hypothetical protein
MEQWWNNDWKRETEEARRRRQLETILLHSFGSSHLRLYLPTRLFFRIFYPLLSHAPMCNISQCTDFLLRGVVGSILEDHHCRLSAIAYSAFSQLSSIPGDHFLTLQPQDVPCHRQKGLTLHGLLTSNATTVLRLRTTLTR